MVRKLAVALSLILASGFVAVSASRSSADTPPASKLSAHGLTADEFSAQSRRILRRAPYRVRVYRRLNPNSVRVCNAHYVQEYRPSGTVITPRMNCYWRG